MEYLDELRIGKKCVVHISDVVRVKLDLKKGFYIIFQEFGEDSMFTFLSYEDKKKMMDGKGNLSLQGQYIDEVKIDNNWNFQVTKRLREHLQVEPEDFLVLYLGQGKNILVVKGEKYSERKENRGQK